MLYLFDRMETFTDKGLEKILPMLPPWRREKVLRYRHMEDRKLSALVCLLLACGLQREYGMEELPAFSYSRQGKPALASRPDIHFSLTHCAAGAACLLAGEPCGVDMQETLPLGDAVAARVCSAKELAALAHQPDRDAALCRLWAAKESVWKLQGTGLPEQPGRAGVPAGVQLFYYEDTEAYHLCCALPQGLPRPALVRVAADELGL